MFIRKMSEKEAIPLSEIKKNEDLTHANNGTRSGHRKHGSSVKSISDTFVNPLTSAVRRGESFKSTFFQETKLDDLDMKESDSLQRNVFHYAVSKPDTLKTLLEMVGTKTSIQDALHQADQDGEMPIHRAASIANIEVVSGSNHGPEGCLKLMIENMPEMARKLLDNCVTTKGSKETRSYQVIYDFFCLEETDTNCGSGPRLEALNCMMENESEACISHPVAVKFVDVKWRKRGFKYSLASITLSMIFHICLIIYTTLVVGEVKQIIVVKEADGKNVTRHIHKRESTSANAPNVMVLRIILLIITSGSVLKEIVQMKVQGIKYFTKVSRYYEISMRILVYLFLLPVEEEISTAHIASGSIAVLYSWITLIQYLKVVPVMGIYIIVVQKIFYTVMKILIVVVIYLLSFSTTFYILLTEHDSFRNIQISIVSTFVAMTSGFEYEEQFVNVGWHAEIYELKMAVLILCILVLSIVVNNALIGLAVGDTDEVMKSAKVDKFKRRANFIIHLEKSVNTIPYLRMKEDKFHIDFPQRKQNLYQKVVGLLYFGSEMDAVDGEKNEHEYEYEIIEMEITWEDHIEKAVELKLENFRSSLRDELKVIHDQIKEDRKHLEEKMEMISEKLK